MNFLADEGVDRPIVERLREAGYTIRYVAELDRGISDDEVLDMANADQALLLTQDKDFGELVYRQKRVMHGVILIRLAGLSPSQKANIVVTTINTHPYRIAGCLFSYNPRRITYST